ncbi:MAG: pirin family protein [Gammaproteobacteria bacterium]
MFASSNPDSLSLDTAIQERQSVIELVLRPKIRDLGEFEVRRVLPDRARRTVGPFVFFDHMGPAQFPPGSGIAVRPHPHIGLATITYLFDGQILHRDSLGEVQTIYPGAVNLMTAGRGIVHSERAGDDLDEVSTLHGIQSWMALPDQAQEIAPSFDHYPAGMLPQLQIDEAVVRVIMGTAFGQTSPVTQYSATLYLECQLPAGNTLDLPIDYAELAVYVVSGEIKIANETYGEGAMAVASERAHITLSATRDARVMVIGGDNPGPRHLWWNFVSNSKARIEQAKADWRNGDFDMVPGDDEFIPLPEG